MSDATGLAKTLENVTLGNKKNDTGAAGADERGGDAMDVDQGEGTPGLDDLGDETTEVASVLPPYKLTFVPAPLRLPRPHASRTPNGLGRHE